MILTLFRGISLSEEEADSVITSIKNEGLPSIKPKDSKCNLKYLKDCLEELFLKPDLSIADTRLATEWVSVPGGGGHEVEIEQGIPCTFFADRYGATYYAQKHNFSEEKPISVLIEVEADIDAVFIDGRDFLYRVFSKLKSSDNAQNEEIIGMLSQVYGKNINRYIDKLFHDSLSASDAICDLISQDNLIIADHHKNNKLIGGRYGTLFYSAFEIKLPIESFQIHNVSRIADDFISVMPDFNVYQP